LLFFTSIMKTSLRFDCLLTLALAGLATHSAQSQSVQPLPDVIAAASDFVTARLHDLGSASGEHFVNVGALDSRLRLPLCTQKPQGFAVGTNFAARMNIGVHCEQPNWTVYVPVSIESELPVWALRRAVPRNAAVTTEDIERQKRRVPGFSANYITEVSQLAGRHLLSAGTPGTALTIELLIADTLIKRGQRVTLIATAGGFEVQAQGEAIADAAASGRVRVLNLSSRKVVEGQAETTDRVRISL
jgi:flagellar basal body P-ring formation protein FlgA